jgi:hypothetical protein
MFGRVSDKSTMNLEKEYGTINLRRPFSVTDRWKDHTRSLTHIASEEKYQQMLDDEKEPDPKKRKNPIPSAIASPPITNFFALKKKKKLDDAEKYNDPIVPKIKSKPSPLYHTQCNGIFSLHEVLNTNAQKHWERNKLLQDGLKIREKYFDDSNGSYCVDILPATDGILNLYAVVSL